MTILTRRFARSLFVGSLLLLGSPAAQAWSDLGHQTVGWIADQSLDPKGQEFVYRILGSEPLAAAATFADQVRSDARFGAFAPYHFVEINFAHTWEKLPKELKAPQSAATILEQAPALLMGDTLDANQKRVLLRYLTHIVGDVHQPLHVGNGTDRGGNLCDVMWRSPETGAFQKMNLHTVWDESLFRDLGEAFQKASGADTGSKRWFGYKELGTIVLGDFVGKLSYKQAAKASIAEWFRDARTLHETVYPPAGVEQKKGLRRYCRYVDAATQVISEGAYDATKVPELSEAYVAKALPVIKRQLLLGGYRLAAILNRAGAQMKLPDHDAAAAKAKLDALLIRYP